MKRSVPLLFLFALLVRFGFGMHHHQPIAPGGDAQVYLRIAESFTGALDPILTRHPPVYPLFLRMAFILPGRTLFVFLLLQSIVSALCIPLAYQLGKSLYSERAGWLAALWITVDPFQIYYSAIMLSETLFTTLLLTSVVLAVGARARGSNVLAFGAGFSLGLTTLCRGILLPLLPFFVIFIWLGPPLGAARRILSGAFLLAGLLLPMVIWSGYVHHRLGRWMLVDSHKGESLYWGLNPNFDRQADIDLWLTRMEQDVAATRLTDPLQVDAYWFQRWKQTIAANPWDFCRLMARKFVKFWRVIPYRSYFPAAYRLVSAAFMVPFSIFFLIGFFGGWRPGKKEISLDVHLVTGLIVIYTLLNVITWTQIRYRIPLHPFLAILAGYGMTLAFPSPRVE